MASAATEPAWLEERRREGASRAEGLALPGPKAKGWEFTDLTGLNLDAYESGPAGATISGVEGVTVLPLAGCAS